MAGATSSPPTTFGVAVWQVAKRTTATRSRVWILAVTVFLAFAIPVLLAAAGDASDRRFTAMSAATLSLMSIPLPFIGALLAGDLRRRDLTPDRTGPPDGGQISAVVAGALLLATILGALGAVTCALATAASADESSDAWRDGGTIAIGCILVAVTSQLVGTGFGLLIRHRVLACAATIVVPLGLWLLLSVEFLKPFQAWLTPFPSAQHLLSGEMSGLAWAQWLATILLWGAGLNTLGARARPR